MNVAIFPNSSYLIVYGASEKIESQFGRIARLFGFCTYFCETFEALKKAELSMTRIIGLFIFLDNLDKSQTNLIIQALQDNSIKTSQKIVISSLPPTISNLNATHCEAPLNPTFDQIKAITDSFFSKLVPLGLNEICLHATNTIFPNFFSNAGSFSSTTISNWQFTCQINFSLIADDVAGFCSVRAKSEQLVRVNQGATKLTHGTDGANEPIEMVLQEAGNQTLGLISQNFQKIGLNLKIGLPTLFDLKKIPEIRTLFYYPKIYLTNSSQEICLAFGFINLDQKPLFDLSQIGSAGVDSGEIEFL